MLIMVVTIEEEATIYANTTTVVAVVIVGFGGGRDDYDRGGYGSRGGYERDYDDRDRYGVRRGWDDGIVIIINVLIINGWNCSCSTSSCTHLYTFLCSMGFCHIHAPYLLTGPLVGSNNSDRFYQIGREKFGD